MIKNKLKNTDKITNNNDLLELINKLNYRMNNLEKENDTLKSEIMEIKKNTEKIEKIEE